MNNQRYPAYQKPKMPWLPTVPAHWDEQRAKVFFLEIDERSRTGSEELLSVSHLTGVTPRSQKKVTMFKAENNSKHKLCRPGDIVINTLWAWMAALGAARHTGLVSPAYGVYRARCPESFNSNYLDYLLRTRAYVAEYNCRSTGVQSSRLRLYPNQFLDIPLIQPPRAEQDQIVAYLRVQDVQIARFIKAKRELIQLFAERRMTLTCEAISSEDTQFHRFDTIASLLDCPIDRKNSETYTPIGLFNRGRGIFQKPSTTGKELGDSTFYSIKEGDLIFSGQFAWEGAVAIAQKEDDGCIASHRYPIIKNNSEIAEASYLCAFFMTKEGDLLLNHHSRGAAGRNRPLNSRTLMKEKIPVPPLHLQEQITACLKAEQSFRREIEKQISFIREHRDRIVADVVTGQVDVRDWVPTADDVVNDDELADLGDADEIEDSEDGDD